MENRQFHRYVDERRMRGFQVELDAGSIVEHLEFSHYGKVGSQGAVLLYQLIHDARTDVTVHVCQRLALIRANHSNLGRGIANPRRAPPAEVRLAEHLREHTPWRL